MLCYDAQSLFLYFIFIGSGFVTPYVLEELITFIAIKDERVWLGIVYALILVVRQFVATYTQSHGFRTMYRLAMRVHSCVIGSIFRKATVLSNKEKQNTSCMHARNAMRDMS